ncbi:MAG: hypothetical protein FI699_09250 [SAR202 cluster bacterium]|nr:hypothetical protein [SAR202 cluster bacterium]|tara:strand:+ start:1787 stop:3049 length:1263 start_codon:yes stop_codon:yes gene_type:complete
MPYFSSLSKRRNWQQLSSSYRTAIPRQVRKQVKQLTASQEPENQVAAYEELLRKLGKADIIRCAMEKLRIPSGTGAGPDGIALKDLENSERWKLAEAIAECVNNNWIFTGDTRKSIIQSYSGNGLLKEREIQIQNIAERCRDKAIVELLAPMLEPQLSPTMFGGQNGSGYLHALAYAKTFTDTNQAHRWVVQDVKSAFDSVELDVLETALRDLIPCERLCSFLTKVYTHRADRGIITGSPLSPLLLNVYLYHVIDKPFAACHPSVPLIRYVDDLMLPCKSEEQAESCCKTLTSLFDSAGLRFKQGGCESVDLREDPCPWLGFEANVEQGVTSYAPTKPVLADIESGCIGDPIHLRKTEWQGILNSLGAAYSENRLSWLTKQNRNRNERQPRRYQLSAWQLKKIFRKSAKRFVKLLETVKL